MLKEIRRAQLFNRKIRINKKKRKIKRALNTILKSENTLSITKTQLNPTDEILSTFVHGSHKTIIITHASQTKKKITSNTSK